MNYDFSWTNPSTANVQCIEVAFSLNADGTGGLPTGMGLAAATLNAYGQTSWTRNNVTGGQVVFTDATIRNAAAGANTLVVGGLTNPSGVGTYYMSVATFDSATVTTGECSGTVRDAAHYTAFAITDGQAVTLAIDPTLTFTVGGTASGTVCNGVTSNNVTTSTTVPLGRLASISARAKGVQDLTVVTNAAGGYIVSASYTGQLTGTPARGSHAFANVAGTHASPILLGAANDGTEAFGYTVNDTDLSQFQTGGTKFAALATANAAVMTKSSVSGSTGDINCIAFQAGMAGNTPADAFTTTVRYNAAARF